VEPADFSQALELRRVQASRPPLLSVQSAILARATSANCISWAGNARHTPPSAGHERCFSATLKSVSRSLLTTMGHLHGAMAKQLALAEWEPGQVGWVKPLTRMRREAMIEYYPQTRTGPTGNREWSRWGRAPSLSWRCCYWG
jgi:hypothetical protein